MGPSAAAGAAAAGLAAGFAASAFLASGLASGFAASGLAASLASGLAASGAGVGAALYVFSALDETFVEKIELPEELARRGVSSVVISNAVEREVVLSSGRAPTDLYLARLGDIPGASSSAPEQS